MIKCIEKCAPQIHAFLIVLKVDRYTEQEKEMISKVKQYFSEEALKHAVVLFTHGDQLEGVTIEDFVKESPDLKKLVEMCGNRCHVVDNKYWKDQQDDYRSNKVQVEQLFNTIQKMKNDHGCYTNMLLQLVGEEKKKPLWQRVLIVGSAVTVGALLGALCGAYLLELVPFIVGGGMLGGAVGGCVGFNSETVQEAVSNTFETIIGTIKIKIDLKGQKQKTM